jgi:predicted nucleic acid-binding protein
VIFLDTNVLYSVLVKTELSPVARNIITGPCDLASSLTVLSELVFISVRRICKNKYGTRNYRDYNRIIAEKGYEPFREEINLIFQLFDERDISIVPVNENIEDWRNIMAKYRLMPSDALIVSTCILNGIKRIATFDNDFKRADALDIIGINEKL